MGFILNKNGENVVLCPAMVNVGSTWAYYCLWGQIGGADMGLVAERLPKKKSFVNNHHKKV
eukprot:8226987-Ditylum_brightwellii.AAC.1